MKTLKILFSILLLSVFIISCSSSGDNSTKIKYQINGLDDSVTKIIYTKGNGSIVTVTNADDFAGGADSKTTSVSNFPFMANLEVTVFNNSSAVKNYDLIIYVNGEAIGINNFSAPPTGTSTGSITFNVVSD